MVGSGDGGSNVVVVHDACHAVEVPPEDQIAGWRGLPDVHRGDEVAVGEIDSARGWAELGRWLNPVEDVGGKLFRNAAPQPEVKLEGQAVR